MLRSWIKNEMSHPSVKEPKDPKIKIWRYMDFAKFVSMLTSGGLFFTRCSIFPDRHEGAMPPANKQLRETQKEVPEKTWRDLALFRKSVRQWTLANCWHINEGESEAGWKLYADSDKAVAIQSTFERLRSVLDKEILCGEI